MWLAKTQVVGSSFATFQGITVGSWEERGTVGAQITTPIRHALSQAKASLGSPQ